MEKKIKKRIVAVVTGTRSEYGILKPLLRRIKKSRDLDLKLFVTGMHLLKKYGFTIKEIEKDGFKTNEKIMMYSKSGKEDLSYGIALGEGIKNFSRLFSKTKLDLVVVFGDRLEPLAATLAAATLRLPIIHIHGGDKSDDGHIDECIRNSITKFAHIHFPPTLKCKNRIIKMDEEPWRVYNVGALNIDSIMDVPMIDKKSLFKELNLNSGQKTIVCIFHSINSEIKEIGKQMKEVIKALKELKTQTVIIYPNNDMGSEEIIKEIREAEGMPFIKIFQNLTHDFYVNLLRHADVLMGNSSSAMIEAPKIKLPAINIGVRNTGREHAENVIFVEADKIKIIEAVKKCFYDEKFKIRVKNCKNPYGEGGASDKILKIIGQLEINKKLLNKNTN
jgi:GDP/UDP-N,N'-diacetylbacillosamine 2-epimerase (hydrolysing)